MYYIDLLLFSSKCCCTIPSVRTHTHTHARTHMRGARLYARTSGVTRGLEGKLPLGVGMGRDSEGAPVKDAAKAPLARRRRAVNVAR